MAALALVWGSALATQYMAARFGYQPRLGAWVYHAPAPARAMLRIALVIVATAAVIAALRPSTRWYSVPLVLSAVSVYAAIAGPIYAPTRVYGWYAKYGSLSQYRVPFLTAWLVVAASVVLVTVAVHRVWRPRSNARIEESESAGYTERAGRDDRASNGRGASRSLGSLPATFRGP